MKYFIYFFAILDILTCFYMTFLLEMFIFDFLHVLFLLLFISLIASAILLVWKTKKGIILNFIQFPLRVVFAIFSFWFLSKLLSQTKISTETFFILATALEFVRLIIEIIIFRNLARKIKN